MEVTKEEPRQAIEPQFLSQAQASGIKLRIGQMNKTEHEGTIRDIGRYEINLEENGKIVTLLKQEMSYLTAPHPVLILPAPQQTSASAASDPRRRSRRQTEYPAGVPRQGHQGEPVPHAVSDQRTADQGEYRGL